MRPAGQVLRRPDDQPNLLTGGPGQEWPEAIAQRRAAPLTPSTGELSFNVGLAPPHRLSRRRDNPSVVLAIINRF